MYVSLSICVYVQRGMDVFFVFSTLFSVSHGSRRILESREREMQREWTAVGRVFVEFHVSLTNGSVGLDLETSFQIFF